MPERCCKKIFDVTKKIDCQKYDRTTLVPEYKWKVTFVKVFGVPVIPYKVELLVSYKNAPVVDVETVVEFGAVFENGEECKCKCCQYRQYVKGQVLVNGVPLTHKIGPGGALTLDPKNLQEDGPNSYGHRKPDKNRPNDQYAPDRDEGCEYTGRDVIYIRNLNPGDTYQFDLEYESRIIDTCNQDKIIDTKPWTVKCQGIA